MNLINHTGEILDISFCELDNTHIKNISIEVDEVTKLNFDQQTLIMSIKLGELKWKGIIPTSSLLKITVDNEIRVSDGNNEIPQVIPQTKHSYPTRKIILIILLLLIIIAGICFFIF